MLEVVRFGFSITVFSSGCRPLGLIGLLLKLTLWFGHQSQRLLGRAKKRTPTLTPALKYACSLLTASKMWHTLWINPINPSPPKDLFWVERKLPAKKFLTTQSPDPNQAAPQPPSSQNELLLGQAFLSCPRSSRGKLPQELKRQEGRWLVQALSEPSPPGFSAVAPSRGRGRGRRARRPATGPCGDPGHRPPHGAAASAHRPLWHHHREGAGSIPPPPPRRWRARALRSSATVAAPARRAEGQRRPRYGRTGLTLQFVTAAVQRADSSAPALGWALRSRFTG